MMNNLFDYNHGNIHICIQRESGNSNKSPSSQVIPQHYFIVSMTVYEYSGMSNAIFVFYERNPSMFK